MRTFETLALTAMDRHEQAKRRVEAATDIVALIAGALVLHQRGRVLVAPCPFHADEAASFTVYPTSQVFYCFGCNTSGDAFTWLMARNDLTFREALAALAHRAGIALPE